MDLEMPVMDGLSCVRRIREMQQDGELRAHVPVIAVTANARSEQIAVAMQTGMVSERPFARFVTSGGWRKTPPLKPLRCFISTGLNRIWNRNHTDTTLPGPRSNKAIPNTGSAPADRSIGASA
jgi:hypothetical protein